MANLLIASMESDRRATETLKGPDFTPVGIATISKSAI
jgi:hypothetical protein